jgi:hypothetical protein
MSLISVVCWPPGHKNRNALKKFEIIYLSTPSILDTSYLTTVGHFIFYMLLGHVVDQLVLEGEALVTDPASNQLISYGCTVNILNKIKKF